MNGLEVYQACAYWGCIAELPRDPTVGRDLPRQIYMVNMFLVVVNIVTQSVDISVRFVSQILRTFRIVKGQLVSLLYWRRVYDS